MRAAFDKRLVKATVFRAASIERWKDAECLHAGGRFQGAIYLCGYALECELKYCVCVAWCIARMEERKAKRLGHELLGLLDAAGMANPLSGNRDLLVAFHTINTRWSTELRYSGGVSNKRESERFPRDSRALLPVAKDGIKIVEKALKKGFASKGAKMSFLFTEESDYKDFIRMFVISDFFRSKTDKERLGEIFSMLEENGAKDAIAKISLCIAMTNREYDREFGKDTWLGRLGDVYHEMKQKPRVARLSRVRSRG